MCIVLLEAHDGSLLISMGWWNGEGVPVHLLSAGVGAGAAAGPGPGAEAVAIDS